MNKIAPNMITPGHSALATFSVHPAALDSGTDVALCEAQVIKDTDDVTNADFSREVCICNNNFHIFATTESATLLIRTAHQGGTFIL